MRINGTSNSHFDPSAVVEMPEEDTGRFSSALVGVDDRVVAVDIDHDMDAEDDAVVVPVNIVENRDAAGIIVDVKNDTADAEGGGVVVGDSKDAAGDCDCVVTACSPSPPVLALALPKSFPISPSLINFVLFFPFFCFFLFLSLSSLNFLTPFLDFRLLFAASNLFSHSSSPSPCWHFFFLCTSLF